MTSKVANGFHSGYWWKYALYNFLMPVQFSDEDHLRFTSIILMHTEPFICGRWGSVRHMHYKVTKGWWPYTVHVSQAHQLSYTHK